MKYGPIGYFFSPHEFPLLAFCIFNLEVNGRNTNVNKTLLIQSEQTLKQISPNILNEFVRKGYS